MASSAEPGGKLALADIALRGRSPLRPS
jgi:hypothetical protein